MIRMRNVGIVLLLCLFGFAGCSVTNGNWRRKEKFTRTVELTAAMDVGSTLKVNTTNGFVTAKGIQTDTCSVTATITGRARKIERAQELAERTQVKLKPDEEGLIAYIHYPQRKKWEFVSISFDITVPNESSLVATTTNGNMTADSLNGNVKIRTTNGNVKMDQILADHNRAQATNGNVT